MNQEEHNRIVNAGLTKLKRMTAPIDLSPEMMTVAKIKRITTEVKAKVRPILDAAVAAGDRDVNKIIPMVAQLFLERVSKLDKDELEIALSQVLTELVTENL